ncbi:MAG: phytanoyl-CoA dioxygenase family protein [Bacteroidota bacterium]
MNKQVSAIFKNELQQKQFDIDGYIKVTLLDDSEIEQLKTLYNHYFPKPSSNFYSSSFESDYRLKKKISDELSAILNKKFNFLFQNYDLIGSAFLSKGNGERSEMPMHQDWTIVDENKHCALNVWVPLQDTNEKNGTLEIIQGSHLWCDGYRAPSIPFNYKGDEHELKSLLTIVPASAGEIIVLNQAVIHFSKANQFEKTRIAITAGIKTANAPLLFYYWDQLKPTEVEEYLQEEDFLIRFDDFHKDIYQRPKYATYNTTKPFQFPNQNRLDIQPLIKKANANKKNELKFFSFLQGKITSFLNIKK